MTAAEVKYWVFTELKFGREPVRRNGSLFELKRVSQVLRNVEHATRVWHRRRVELSDHVLVETLPNGETRNHWRHTLRDEDKTEVTA